MGYRFFCERVEPIGQKSEAAGTDIVLPVKGYEGMRLTIPYLSVKCGATAQVLTILQVKDYDRIKSFDAAARKVTAENISDDLTDSFIALEKPDGDYFFSQVTGSAAKVHTITESFPSGGLKQGGRIFVFCKADDELCQKAELEAGKVNDLSQEAPGRFMARDLCFPLIIMITNSTNPAAVLGGSAVYISR